MLLKEFLFTEKYRPQTLDDIIIPSDVRDMFKFGVKQNYLFYGTPGTGKTSLAKILVKQFKHPYLYINASKDTSVEVIRKTITDFCYTAVISSDADTNPIKVVILDEVDGASGQFFKAFKVAMEEFHKTVRFIAISNYVNKIDDAIQSRFDGGMINFDFPKEYKEEMVKNLILRTHRICKDEKIEADVKALYKLISDKFPDYRRVLDTIQAYKIKGVEKITLKELEKFASVNSDIFELIFTNMKPEENYKYLVANYSNRVDDVFALLGKQFIEYIQIERPAHIKHIPDIIICVAKYQSMKATAIDSVITMLACIYEIQSIIKK